MIAKIISWALWGRLSAFLRTRQGQWVVGTLVALTALWLAAEWQQSIGREDALQEMRETRSRQQEQARKIHEEVRDETDTDLVCRLIGGC